MAYRAGAELKDLELVHRHAGPKYLARCGQATWVGVLRDIKGNPVGVWTDKPNRRYGDIATEVSKVIFEEYKKSGRGPAYMDMNGISKEDLDYMIHWMKNEGNVAIIDYLKEEGIDFGKAAVEFQTYEMQVDGGIRANHLGETRAKGLFAAGDEVFPTISHAAVFGWSAGESAAKHTKETKAPKMMDATEHINSRKMLLEEIRNRKEGTRWQEALCALQQIAFDYCGEVRSHSLLSTGLKLVAKLKRKTLELLKAENSHELMHCLEVLDLIDIGELLFICALDRNETRAFHVRKDYPFTDPLLNDKIHVIRQMDGKPVTDWVTTKR
jgi:succinate dehydrogenase/fumarate reductase flavoprotein subunit